MCKRDCLECTDSDVQDQSHTKQYLHMIQHDSIGHEPSVQYHADKEKTPNGRSGCISQFLLPIKYREGVSLLQY